MSPGVKAKAQPRQVTLLDLYEQARHGILIRHRRRSDEDRPLCRKVFRVGAASRRGWDRECAQCSRESLRFAAQQHDELAKFARAQLPPGNGEAHDGAQS